MQKYKKIFIFTTAGGKYKDWYEKYTLPSIYPCCEKLKNEGYEISLIQNGFNVSREQGNMPKPKDFQKYGATDEVGCIILPGLRSIIQKCVDEDAIFFLAPPDTIFAKDTLYNMVKMSENKMDCIALPHIRMSVPEEEIKNPTSKELVALAFKYAHDAFIGCFDSLEKNGTHAGISVRRINDSIYSMIHNLPTVYLAKFTARDIQFWNNTPVWGNWDRAWLRMLYIENRVKVVGSSALGFCVELTESESNKPERVPGLQYNDKYFINDVHNNTFNKFAYILEL